MQLINQSEIRCDPGVSFQLTMQTDVITAKYMANCTVAATPNTCPQGRRLNSNHADEIRIGTAKVRSTAAITW